MADVAMCFSSGLLVRLMGYPMICFDLEFGRYLCSRTAVQMYFRYNPQMTLGQRMTLGGQIVSGKVRSDSCESFGAIFGALAPLGEPQSAVQI